MTKADDKPTTRLKPVPIRIVVDATLAGAVHRAEKLHEGEKLPTVSIASTVRARQAYSLD